MASHKALLIAAAAMAVIVGALLPVTASAVDYMVGDMDGWDLNVDYDNWVRINKPFRVGDNLDFKYDPSTHDVIMLHEDDESSYKSCIVPLTVWSLNTGNDRVQLAEEGKYFFFCSFFDHCQRGMKFSIEVIGSSDG